MALRKNLKRPAPEKECDKLRKRRRRTAFTNMQVDRLEESFEKERFPGIQIREDLARELKIGEDRIQVWFQNRRARWRKREIKNKPAPAHSALEWPLVSSDVTSPTMFQPLPAILPPLNSALFRPSEPFYPPFTVSGSFASASLHRETKTLPAASQASQTANVLFHPSVLASVSPPFSSCTSPFTSLENLCQISCGGTRYSSADYLAAVTLASCFQRES